MMGRDIPLQPAGSAVEEAVSPLRGGRDRGCRAGAAAWVDTAGKRATWAWRQLRAALLQEPLLGAGVVATGFALCSSLVGSFYFLSYESVFGYLGWGVSALLGGASREESTSPPPSVPASWLAVAGGRTGEGETSLATHTWRLPLLGLVTVLPPAAAAAMLMLLRHRGGGANAGLLLGGQHGTLVAVTTTTRALVAVAAAWDLVGLYLLLHLLWQWQLAPCRTIEASKDVVCHGSRGFLASVASVACYAETFAECEFMAFYLLLYAGFAGAAFAGMVLCAAWLVQLQGQEHPLLSALSRRVAQWLGAEVQEVESLLRKP